MFIIPLIALFILFSGNALGDNYYEIGKHLAEELKQKETHKEEECLRKMVSEIKLSHTDVQAIDLKTITKGKCAISNSISSNHETKLYIFVSFSMPNETFPALSKELEKADGVFVLRGLPENSFKKLAEKIYTLRKQGINATFQLDPLLFHKYNIEKVPTFVTIGDKHFDKLCGNVSLRFALEKINSETAKNLRSRL
jgi:type-F conjugative transfer system pilin assembly protein TrbC